VHILTLVGIVSGYVVIISGFNSKGRMKKLHEEIHSLKLSIIIDSVFIHIYLYVLLFNRICNMCKFASQLQVYRGCFYAHYNMIRKYLILYKGNGCAGQEECKENSEFQFKKKKIWRLYGRSRRRA